MKSRNFHNIELSTSQNILTGNQLFDKWFSKDGGIVPGSIIFVTGTSGAGKTTLMVNLMNWLKNHKTSFYSREMRISSLKQQVKDYKFDNDNAFFVDEEDCVNLEEYLSELDVLKPDFVIVDSLQAIASVDYSDMSEEKGSVHVREILTKWCKENNCTLFIIGHNTKDNEFAGKNTNMQMVDAHMVLEYDKKTETRTIFWGKKNRKGPMGLLFYEINDGEISFYENNPNLKSAEKVLMSQEIETLIYNYFKRLDPENPKTGFIKSEFEKISSSVFRDNKNNHSDYIYSLAIEFFRMLKKQNLF